MNVGLAVTAAFHGATVANHVEVVSLKKKTTEDGKSTISGATLRDTLTGNSWEVEADVIVNATGAHVGTYCLQTIPNTNSNWRPRFNSSNGRPNAS